MVFGTIVLATVGLQVDRRWQPAATDVFGLLYSGGPEAARSILATVASSMITVAGVVFSITMVVLALATSQFGPRLLRNFRTDRGNQIVLGAFIATFIYCLIVLQAATQFFVPRLSVAVSLALALLDVCILIYFIHHISVSIQADHVTTMVYRELMANIQRLFPDELKEPPVEAASPESFLCDSADRPQQPIPAPHDGYVQVIELDRLRDIATKHDFVLLLHCCPGQFVVSGENLATARGAGKLDDELAQEIARAVIIGSQRTPAQDIEFSIHQLVEVAIRALSPSVNDPYTAIACIDRLAAALCRLSGKAFPSSCTRDSTGKPRVFRPASDFSGVLNAAFDQIRQYGRSSVAVTIHLLEALGEIAALAQTHGQARAILRQAQMILRASRDALPEVNDRHDVERRYDAVVELLRKRFSIR